MKEGFDAGEQAVISLGTCTVLELVQKFMFLTFLSIYTNKSIYKVHSVAAIKNNDIYRKYFGTV